MVVGFGGADGANTCLVFFWCLISRGAFLLGVRFPVVFSFFFLSVVVARVCGGPARVC